MALALGLIVPVAPASGAPSPATGPTAGGTRVSDVLPGLSFTHRALGYAHSLALGSDGVTYAWGDNTKGELGDGSTVSSMDEPVAVKAPDGVTFTQLAAGSGFSVAIGSDRNVYAWGLNDQGQLGAGSTEAQSETPVRVRFPEGVHATQISAGAAHTLAIADDGNTYAWGFNWGGGLGNGTNMSSFVPVTVNLPAGVHFVQVSVGGSDSLAIGSDGKVYVWGLNQGGPLGDGSTSGQQYSPVPAKTPEGISFIQGSTGFASAAAVTTDGDVYGWGNAGAGQLGDGATGDDVAAPIKMTNIPAGVRITAISSGYAHMMATGSDGKIYGWGANQVGQLGRGGLGGSTEPNPVPEPVATPEGVSFSEASAAFMNSSALGSDGMVYTWGTTDPLHVAEGSLEGTGTPTPLIPVTVNEVLFGTTPGTELSRAANKWTVTAPAGCGVRDVTVNYTQQGVDASVMTQGGFSQGTAPQITAQPKDVSVDEGSSVTLAAAATGDNEPTVQWQQAATADGPWSNIPGATTAETTITPDQTGLVRAVFSNCIGTATTDAATITVTAVTPTPTPSTGPSSAAPGGTPTSGESSPAAAGSQVSTSGSASGPAAGVAAAVLFLALGAAIAAGYKARGSVRR